METCARVVQTFWPLTTHSSPSRLPRLGMPATSEPLVGSENICEIVANNQTIPVRVAHQFESVDDLKNLVVGYKGMPLGAGGSPQAIDRRSIAAVVFGRRPGQISVAAN